MRPESRLIDPDRSVRLIGARDRRRGGLGCRQEGPGAGGSVFRLGYEVVLAVAGSACHLGPRRVPGPLARRLPGTAPAQHRSWSGWATVRSWLPAGSQAEEEQQEREPERLQRAQPGWWGPQRRGPAPGRQPAQARGPSGLGRPQPA